MLINILKSLLGLRNKPAFSDASSWVNPDSDKAHRARHDTELAAMLSNRSGHVREAAVIRAEELLLPTVLPHLMPRINDWVPQVQLAANKAVEAYLLAGMFDAVLYALPSVYWLRSCKRRDHTAFIAHIEKFLVEHHRAKEIPATLTDRIGVQARCLFDLSWRYELAP